MANLPIFNGNGNVNIWIATMDVHFAGNNIVPPHALQTAMAHLSQDVRACVEGVHTRFELVTTTEWAWTWARLRFALQGMWSQINRYAEVADRIRTRQIIKGVAMAGTGIAVTVAAMPVALGVLGAVGFGATGVAAGSAAAAIQSAIGCVEAGSLFAFCQSAAAGGAALLSVGAVGAATGTTIGIGGIEASAEEWERIRRQVPSYSWSDGHDFRPSPELMIALADHA